MNVPLPDPLKQCVDDEVREGGSAGTSNCVRDPIAQRPRAGAKGALRSVMAEGLAARHVAPFEGGWFDELRTQAGLRAST
jgi:hypothetical protein